MAPRAPRVLAALLGLALPAAGAWSQPVRSDFPITNGPVHALAEAGGTIYVGGDFTRIGPPRPYGAVLSATTGEPLPCPRLDDVVYGSTADGNGGWFIGGHLNSVDGLPRTNLAHIRADGTPSPWSPSPGASVYVLATGDSTVYVGGNFAEMNGQTRIKVAAVDDRVGALRPWDARLDYVNSNSVDALEVSGSRIYIGGDFYTEGLARRHLTAVDAVTGTPLAWGPVVNGPVFAILVEGGTVYLGGRFTSVNGAPRARLAAVDVVSGALTPWNPGANADVWGLERIGTTLYAGGSFDSIGGIRRGRLAAFDLASGDLTAWDPGVDGNVFSLAVSGSTVFAGGFFTAVGGERRDRVAAIDAASGRPTDWDPAASWTVSTVAAQGDRVFVGGIFSGIAGTKRHNLAAVEVASGAVRDWDPHPNHIVRALAVDGALVYAGGSFDSIGDRRRRRIAAIDALTGIATDWNPGADGGVRALAVDGARVYAGGLFTAIGGEARQRIAAIDAATGRASSWDPGADSTVRALVVHDGRVFAGGTFRRIGSEDRPLVAALSPSSGRATAWRATSAGTDPDVYALAARGSILYVAGDFTTMGGQPRRGLAALNTASGEATAWAPATSLTHYALGLQGTGAHGGAAVVYTGDSQRVTAFDGESGGPVGWRPEVFGPVYALSVGGPQIVIGGDLEHGRLVRPVGLAAVLEPATATLVARFTAEPLLEGIALRWRLGAATHSPTWIERAVVADGPWERLDLEVRDQDGERWALDRSVEVGHNYHYRLMTDAGDGPMALGMLSATAGAAPPRHGLTRVTPLPSPGRTTIEFAANGPCRARLQVFDLQGRLEAELLDERVAPGIHQAIWNGEGRHGRSPAGLYLVRLELDGRRTTARLVVTR